MLSACKMGLTADVFSNCKAGNVHTNVTLTRTCVTTVAGQSTKFTYSECICSISYPGCKAHGPYYIIICGLSGSIMFYYDINSVRQHNLSQISI